MPDALSAATSSPREASASESGDRDASEMEVEVEAPASLGSPQAKAELVEPAPLVVSDILPLRSASNHGSASNDTPASDHAGGAEEDNGATGAEVRIPRCEVCRKQRQRCSWNNQSGKCDKCHKMNYECEVVDSIQPRPPARRKNPKKKHTKSKQPQCVACQAAHLKCLPENRTGPEKCTLCKRRGLDCEIVPTKPGPPHSSKDGSARTSKPRDSRSAHLEDSDGSESADSDSDASIPAIMPLQRKRRRLSDGKDSESETTAELKDKMGRMEEEYQEVFRDMQAKHDQELSFRSSQYNALKTKYERAVQDLAKATQNHERRVDDLIHIMKNNERRADELIQALKNKN